MSTESVQTGPRAGFRGREGDLGARVILREPAVLLLLENDPMLYVVKCCDITDEVRCVMEAVREGSPSPGGASEIWAYSTLPEDLAIVAIVRKHDSDDEDA